VEFYYNKFNSRKNNLGIFKIKGVQGGLVQSDIKNSAILKGIIQNKGYEMIN
jgi:hypothetical protein